MTGLTWLLLGLLLTVGTAAAVLLRRYRQLQRKHKTLQQLHHHAERQLATLWSRQPPAGP